MKGSCSACGITGMVKRCSRCHTAKYCGTSCQRHHWPHHKAACRAAATPSPTAIAASDHEASHCSKGTYVGGSSPRGGGDGAPSTAVLAAFVSHLLDYEPSLYRSLVWLVHPAGQVVSSLCPALLARWAPRLAFAGSTSRVFASDGLSPVPVTVSLLCALLRRAGTAESFHEWASATEDYSKVISILDTTTRSSSDDYVPPIAGAVPQLAQLRVRSLAGRARCLLAKPDHGAAKLDCCIALKAPAGHDDPHVRHALVDTLHRAMQPEPTAGWGSAPPSASGNEAGAGDARRPAVPQETVDDFHSTCAMFGKADLVRDLADDVVRFAIQVSKALQLVA